MEHIEPSYELPYVSTWGYFIDFEGGKIINNNLREDRKIFDQYPIYLKHSLYIHDEQLNKLRTMEINQRFFAQDEPKEEGNWHYRKKNYHKALHYYEYALSPTLERRGEPELKDTSRPFCIQMIALDRMYTLNQLKMLRNGFGDTGLDIFTKRGGWYTESPSENSGHQ